MKVTVVIPTLEERDHIAGAIRSVREQEVLGQIVVADGGSRDDTLSRLPTDVRVVRTAASRARQLNAGAAAAEGDVLLFLHADCRLPRGALSTALLALRDEGVVGGGFHKRFDTTSRLVRWGGRWRTRLWHAAGALFGDQALFVRRSEFDAVGGFREDVRAEDLDLVLRLRRRGRVVLLPPAVTASARRLHEQGVVRTWLTWWRIGLAELWREAREARRTARQGPARRSAREDHRAPDSA